MLKVHLTCVTVKGCHSIDDIFSHWRRMNWPGCTTKCLFIFNLRNIASPTIIEFCK